MLKSLCVLLFLCPLILLVHCSEERMYPSAWSRYTVVHPVIYHGRSKRELSSTRQESGTHHDEVLISMDVEGDQYMLELRLNHDLLPEGHSISYQEGGKTILHKPGKEEIDLCQYVGHIRGKPKSWVALSTCRGLRGAIHDGSKIIYIEPAEGNDIQFLHYVYEDNDVERGHCGHDDQVAKLDHLLMENAGNDSLLIRHKRDSSFHLPYKADENSRYVELVLVVDYGLYEDANRDMWTLHHQLQEVTNVMSAMYSPLNIFIALTGVEVWTTGDQIDIDHDIYVTLARFAEYRQKHLFRSIGPHDHAQLVTNKPKRLLVSPSCGNGFVDPGEECDCGPAIEGFETKECHRCCNPETCRFKPRATCATGACCDLQTCQIKSKGAPCRAAKESCDLPEYCTGSYEFCPDDVFVMDTTPCSNKAYCMQGQCRTHESQCQMLWGNTARNAHYDCYMENTKGNEDSNCGYDLLENKAKACSTRDVLCGRLICLRNDEIQIGDNQTYNLYNTTITKKYGVSFECHMARFEFGLGDVDPGLVPDGAACGDDQMCYQQQCLPLDYLRRKIVPPLSPGCQANCSGHGVCNSIGFCHCEKGFEPPLCVAYRARNPDVRNNTLPPPKYPGGRDNIDKLPDPKYPGGRDNRGKQPDLKYPDGRDNRGEHPDPKYPGGRDNRREQPDPRYPGGRDNRREQPEPKYPGGRDNRHEQPDPKYPGGRDNRREQPDPKYPGGRDNRHEQPDPRYPSGRDNRREQPDPKYPGGRDNRREQPDPKYPGGRDNRGKQPDPKYPGGRDNRREQPDPKYPGGRDNRGKQPDPKYPGGRDNRHEQPDPRYPSGRDNRREQPDPKYPGGRDNRREQPDPKYPGGRDNRREQPDPKYPGGRDNRGKQPDPKYPGGRDNRREQPDPKYPGSRDNRHEQPNPRYPGGRDNRGKKPDLKYPGGRDNRREQPDQKFPGGRDNRREQPDPRYPGGRDNGGKKPDPKYPGGRDNRREQPDPKYPGGRDNGGKQPDPRTTPSPTPTGHKGENGNKPSTSNPDGTNNTTPGTRHYKGANNTEPGDKKHDDQTFKLVIYIIFLGIFPLIACLLLVCLMKRKSLLCFSKENETESTTLLTGTTTSVRATISSLFSKTENYTSANTNADCDRNARGKSVHEIKTSVKGTHDAKDDAAPNVTLKNSNVNNFTKLNKNKVLKRMKNVSKDDIKLVHDDTNATVTTTNDLSGINTIPCKRNSDVKMKMDDIIAINEVKSEQLNDAFQKKPTEYYDNVVTDIRTVNQNLEGNIDTVKPCDKVKAIPNPKPTTIHLLHTEDMKLESNKVMPDDIYEQWPKLKPVKTSVLVNNKTKLKTDDIVKNDLQEGGKDVKNMKKYYEDEGKRNMSLKPEGNKATHHAILQRPIGNIVKSTVKEIKDTIEFETNQNVNKAPKPMVYPKPTTLKIASTAIQSANAEDVNNKQTIKVLPVNKLKPVAYVKPGASNLATNSMKQNVEENNEVGKAGNFTREES